MEGSREVDVAIVGFGPVGALSGLLLANAGMRVVILERETEPVVLPRAVGMDGESMRTFQRVGLDKRVDAIVQPPRGKEQICFADSQRRPLFGLEVPEYGHNGWRDVAFFDQPHLEALLREEVDRTEGIEVRLGREVARIEQSDDAVLVQHGPAAGAADETVSAAFLLGCDGASSFVRRSLGIEWASLGYDQDWLVIDIVINEEAQLTTDTMQVCDPARLTTYVAVRDPNRRWEFQLLPGETREEMLRPEKVAELLGSWLPPEHYSLRRAAVYQFHAATAERLRSGRIFLAGDSAHQTPPFLGQGLNSGFRDAANLGWKIPLVHSGLCDASMLDSYAGERDLHARDLVECAVGIGRLMETLAAREAGKPDPYDAAQIRLPPPGGPLVPPLRGGLLVGEQIADDSSVGHLLRQPLLKLPGGGEGFLDELLGGGFSVVGRTESDLVMGAEAAAVLQRVGGCSVSLEGLENSAGQVDRLFDAHPAALVRPDRHVFGVVDAAHDLDSIVLELARQLCMTV